MYFIELTVVCIYSFINRCEIFTFDYLSAISIFGICTVQYFYVLHLLYCINKSTVFLYPCPNFELEKNVGSKEKNTI